MEDLKPPYIFRCPSPPFIRVPRTLTPYRRRQRWRPETDTIFFSLVTKTSVSATDVWFDYPREKRFKEVKNWPDTEKTSSFSTSRRSDRMMKRKWNLFAFYRRISKDSVLFFGRKFIITFLNSPVDLRINTILSSEVNAIAEPSGIWSSFNRSSLL